MAVEQNPYSTALRGGSSSSEDGPPQRWNKTMPPNTAQLSEAYYLIWSPGFAKKVAVATALLASVRSSGWDLRFARRMLWNGGPISVPGFVSNLVLPLLSSSCCAVQLAINAMSVLMGAGIGCVGFNTFLGPLRPYLLAVMLAYTRTTTSSTLMAPGFLVAFLVRYSIAFLPEFVFWWNEILRAKWRPRGEETKTTTAAIETDGRGMVRATLIVDVPTMGCVACVNKIESSLRQCAPENMNGATSWLNPSDEESKKKSGKKGGQAQVELCAASRDELDKVSRTVIDTIESAGFGGTTIQSLDVDDDEEDE